ncbi:uncharacterized protein TNCV_3153201 [Trichonephila clavipes]|nr:uncharacterized protein TNCV_3153201 [Trichonephila clavipes]
MPSPFLLIFLPAVLSSVWACPPEQSIAPACICRDFGDGAMMTCSNITSAEELVPYIKTTDSLDMFALTIMESTLLYIPSGVFKNTKYQKIRFLNTQLMSLTDGFLAFEGLEDRLEELRATDAHYITQWDWSQLRNHRRLNLIDINLIEMHALEQEFPPLESLNMLGISKAAISFIHPKAFAGLVNLKILHLRDNSIDKMSRSMLPSLAKELAIIDLSGNLLTSLPEDMFHRMPNLMQVELNHNKLVTLKEETFSWVFQHLQTLMFIGNDFRCDCRMKWIVDIKKPLYFKGTCAVPEDLNGVSLTYLTHKKLWC